MSSECDRYIELVKDELAGELDRAEAVGLEEHLSSCESCRKERLLLEQVVLNISAVEEEAVPHHFFVYGERKVSFWDFLSQLTLGWKWATAGAAALCLAVAVLVVSQVSFSYGSGTFSVSFGQDFESRATAEDLQQLRKELLDSFRQIAREESETELNALRTELKTSLVAFGEQSQVQLEERLGTLEGKLGRTIDLRNTQLQNQMESTIGSLGNLLIAQHQSDMRAVRQQFNQAASLNRIQANQTDAIVATLVQLADATTR